MLKNKLSIIETGHRKTISQPCLINGYSLFSKKKCWAKILPARANFGLVFQYQNVRVRAIWSNIDQGEKEHTTTLIKNNLRIRTTEHLLAALWGLGIDDALIILSEPAIPLRDASAEYYTATLKKAGIKKIKAPRKYLVFCKKHKFKENDNDDRWAIFSPSSKLIIDSTTSFNNLIGSQRVIFRTTSQNFQKQIAWARSFFRPPINNKSDWEKLRSKIAFLPPNPRQSPIIVFNHTRYLTPLRKDDEPGRHKILDFIGDISLLGIRIKAKIKLFKPGHRFNRQIVQKLSWVLKSNK